MMDMNDAMGQCMNALSSMMGGVIFFVILLVLLIWAIGLAAVGALIFWGVRKLSSMRSASG